MLDRDFAFQRRSIIHSSMVSAAWLLLAVLWASMIIGGLFWYVENF